jgi:hypothetical protein
LTLTASRLTSVSLQPHSDAGAGRFAVTSTLEREQIEAARAAGAAAATVAVGGGDGGDSTPDEVAEAYEPDFGTRDKTEREGGDRRTDAQIESDAENEMFVKANFENLDQPDDVDEPAAGIRRKEVSLYSESSLCLCG